MPPDFDMGMGFGGEGESQFVASPDPLGATDEAGAPTVSEAMIDFGAAITSGDSEAAAQAFSVAMQTWILDNSDLVRQLLEG